MPLPFIIGGLAAVAGTAGVGSGIHGGVKMKKAKDTMNAAKEIQKKAVERFESRNESTTKKMDALGELELSIMSSFDEFADLIEKIQGRPEFKSYSKDGVNLPEFEAEELKKVGVGAGLLMGGLGGAAAGTAGGFAAAGATTSAVMALGTASTGTAISTLSGAAATNAALAALGGGAVAANGGGMALGAAVLGGATLGVGLLIGGVIFNVTGSKLSDKADEAYDQAWKTSSEVTKICGYLTDLSDTADSFVKALNGVNTEYRKRLSTLDHIINFCEKTEWWDFTEKEQQLTENLVLLVGLLYSMCQVNLVIKSEKEGELNQVNKQAVKKAIKDSKDVLNQIQ